MSDTEDTRDNLTRLLNLGRRKRPRISRRYTFFVNGFRFLLPVIALIIIGVVLAWPKMDKAITPVPKQSIIPDKTGRNELLDPHFEGMSKDQKPYVITATRAVQDMNDQTIVLLEEPVADVILQSGLKMTTKATHGVYRQDSRILVLDGKVEVQHQSGYTVHSDRLNISVDDKISWTDTAVHGEGPAGTLDAKAMNANNNTGVVVFTGPAKLVLNQSSKGSTP